MISTVTIKLAPEELMGAFYISSRGVVNTAMDNYNAYKILPCFAVDAEGEAAAEEVFDLTNNPSRQAEREQLYGRGRSLSVGDIVEVDDVNYLCAPMGWINLEVEMAE